MKENKKIIFEYDTSYINKENTISYVKHLNNNLHLTLKSISNHTSTYKITLYNKKIILFTYNANPITKSTLIKNIYLGSTLPPELKPYKKQNILSDNFIFSIVLTKLIPNLEDRNYIYSLITQDDNKTEIVLKNKNKVILHLQP